MFWVWQQLTLFYSSHWAVVLWKHRSLHFTTPNPTHHWEIIGSFWVLCVRLRLNDLIQLSHSLKATCVSQLAVTPSAIPLIYSEKEILEMEGREYNTDRSFITDRVGWQNQCLANIWPLELTFRGILHLYFICYFYYLYKFIVFKIVTLLK